MHNCQRKAQNNAYEESGERVNKTKISLAADNAEESCLNPAENREMML